MNRKESYFFATLNDICSVLEDIETRLALKYVNLGMFSDDERPIYSTFRDLPEFGYSESGNNMLNPRYLVSQSDHNVVIERVFPRNGELRYSVGNSTNQEAIVFAPGGLHKASGSVIEGRITMNYATDAALELYGRFLKSFKGRFRSVRGNFVGDEAYAVLEAGGRLTQRIRASTDYDLQK